MERRTFLIGSAAYAATAVAGSPLSPMGICIYSYGSSKQQFADTLAFLDHCHAIGASGAQMELTSLDPAFAQKVRAKCVSLGLYYEGIVSLPKGDGAQFEREIIAAKTAGARVVRAACLSGRRYETFHDREAWQRFVQDSHAALQAAGPILEKHRIALALENHKDWTVDDLLELMRKYGSEYLGVCLDFGNNLALLDGPDRMVKLAPYALATHVKDIALEPASNGFNMSEVQLGSGIVDVMKLVSAIREAHPNTRLSLEMITRDPLSIPCLTDGYWVTFPERKNSHLQPALERAQSAKNRLPRISQESKETQARMREENIKSCLRYARENLAS